MKIMILFRLGPLSNEIDRIYNKHYRNSPHQETHDFYRAVKRRIRKAYQQDRVDVTLCVTCRDCTHRLGDENPMCMLHTEPAANARGYKGEAVCVEMTDFCSYGKRKEGTK